MVYRPHFLTLLASEWYETADKPRLWNYVTTDPMTTVRAANCFSDALLKCLKKGDYVVVTTRTGLT